jgi:hypothetical protein
VRATRVEDMLATELFFLKKEKAILYFPHIPWVTASTGLLFI